MHALLQNMLTLLFHTSVLGSVLNTEQTLLTFTALNIYSHLPEDLEFSVPTNFFLSLPYKIILTTVTMIN